MTARQETALTIAHGALLDLETASHALEMLDGLLFFADNGKDIPGAASHIGTLISLARAFVYDAANTSSSNYETLSRQLDELAPQNAQPENVARIPVGLEVSLADRVLLARESAGLSQADLAKLVGTRQTSISQIESGKTKRTSYLAEIARACLVDIHWLAFGLEGGQ